MFFLSSSLVSVNSPGGLGKSPAARLACSANVLSPVWYPESVSSWETEKNKQRFLWMTDDKWKKSLVQYFHKMFRTFFFCFLFFLSFLFQYYKSDVSFTLYDTFTFLHWSSKHKTLTKALQMFVSIKLHILRNNNNNKKYIINMKNEQMICKDFVCVAVKILLIQQP